MSLADNLKVILLEYLLALTIFLNYNSIFCVGICCRIS